MNTVNKDKRRTYETNLQNDHHEAWRLSYKYSGYLLNNIDSDDLYDTCLVNHGQFMNELKNKGIKTTNNKGGGKNYSQIWTTMLHTVAKYDNNSRGAVSLLHQTNQQRVSKLN